jgi:hypothetical protein
MIDRDTRLYEAAKVIKILSRMKSVHRKAGFRVNVKGYMNLMNSCVATTLKSVKYLS